MKLPFFLAAFLFIAASTPGLAAPLDAKSLAPAWGKATQAEKDAWMASFKTTKPGVDKAHIAECLDKYAGKPLFETNELAGMTGMCESIAALPN